MDNDQREFWSTIAKKYDRVVDLQIGGKTRSLVRSRLSKENRLGNLAEFGCGTGFYTQVLADKSTNVMATDLSPGMLAVARERIKATNVRFQAEDCEKTSFPDGIFDTTFMSLLIHFTEPRLTLAEMRRILKPAGSLILANLDPNALHGIDRLCSLIRILYNGIIGYRLKPPKGFAKNVLSEKQLCKLLNDVGFEVLSVETIKDTSRSSNIPVEYIRAVKI
jgi:ABC-2 type transport system ATP-binding protein